MAKKKSKSVKVVLDGLETTKRCGECGSTSPLAWWAQDGECPSCGNK